MHLYQANVSHMLETFKNSKPYIHVTMHQIFSLKNKHVGKIAIGVGDQQISSLPLIYQTEFSEYNLRIGDNILSQYWQTKKLAANYFSDKNSFRYISVYIQRIYTKYLYILLQKYLYILLQKYH